MLVFCLILCYLICSCQSDPELPIHLWALVFRQKANELFKEQGMVSCFCLAASRSWEVKGLWGFFCWRVPFLQVLRCSKPYLHSLSRRLLLSSSKEALHYSGKQKVLTVPLSVHQGGGCALMTRSNKFEQIVRGMNSVSQSTCWQPEMSWWSRLCLSLASLSHFCRCWMSHWLWRYGRGCKKRLMWLIK